MPIVAETYDGLLNDINGFHAKKDHVFAALDSAKSGPVAEGNVGGGTAMNLFRRAKPRDPFISDPYSALYQAEEKTPWAHTRHGSLIWRERFKFARFARAALGRCHTYRRRD
jgi:hypothetical protein